MSDAPEVKAAINPGAGTTMAFPYFDSLNAAQHSAVIAPPSTPLQILAGPGSGKTRVLTSRVAYLVQRHGYKPYEIVAVTFTNKSANEMRKRLRVLLGEQQADNLVLGTFHSMCARYLRRYGRHISLPNTFTITDADDAKKTMSRLIKAKADVLSAMGTSLKERAVLLEISKAKAKGEGPEGMAARARNDPSSSTSTLTFIADLYAEYEESLRAANALDFDDLLVFGLKLFTEVPEVLRSCKHILVDEFQDTNTTQYELMKCFAKVNNGVSVVGDPDQSIYGWRSAEVENLDKMTRDFPGVQAIHLEQNYRSTGAILAAAHSVVSQDSSRIKKKLFTSHPRSTPVNLKVFANPTIEASFIATEIKRMIAYSGGVLNYGDFAILLRYNALSRVIESALQKDSIPNRIIGGHKFFERMEIKDLLAYLQLAENPGFTPAFMRVVNVPKRSIGDKSIADLILAAKQAKISPMELCERIVDGDQLPAGVKPAIKKNLANFVGIGTSVADLLRSAIEKTGYEHYLRTSYGPDFESKWENVQELISYCVVVAEEQAREADSNDFLPDTGFVPASSAAAEAVAALAAKQEAEDADRKLHPMFRSRSASGSRSRSASIAAEEQPRKRRKVIGERLKVEEDVIEVLSDSDDDVVLSDNKGSEEDKTKMKPLSYFLQTSMLSTDTEASNEEDKDSNLKVTITTVHSAKGLEWPVVFIPAVEQGTYPSYRCTEATEIAEERRLLYVAMTRAQTFLTMSHCQFRMAGGEENDKTLSEFVGLSFKSDPTLFTLGLPEIDTSVRKTLAGMLQREKLDETAIDDVIRKHIRAAPPLSTWDPPEPRDSGHNRFARRDVTKAARAAEYWASEQDDYALPDMNSGFTSARSAPSHGSRPSHGGSSSSSSRLPKPYQMGYGTPRSPAKPVVKLPQRQHDFSAPLPFAFNNPDAGKKKEEASLGLFEKGNMDFLSDLKSLVDSDSALAPASSTTARAGPTNGLGLPKLNNGGTASAPPRLANGLNVVGGVQKKPAKRLGMGRLPQWQPK